MKTQMLIIGAIVGAIAGFLYWKYVGCASGTCAITSSKMMSSLYGAVLGGLLFSYFNVNQFFSSANAGNDVQNVSQNNVANLLATKEYQLIDVRTTGEVSEGYIKNTKHFFNVSSGDFEQKIATLDKTKKYLVYCRSGARSQRASKKMIAAGFQNIYNLEGGISSYSGEVIRQGK